MHEPPLLRRRHVLLGAALGAGPAGAAACVKRLAWAEDAPHTQRLPDGRVGGVEIELHRALLERLDCELQTVEMPFARALVALRQGEVDVLPATLARPEREAFAHFSQPLLQLRNRLFVRRGEAARLAGRTLTELVDAGWRVGGLTGAAYGSEYVALLQWPARRALVVQVPYRDSLWQMLARRRVDGVLANELTGLHDLQRLGLQNAIEAIELALPAESGGSAWSRRSTPADFVERFNGALQQLRQSGRYAEIVARYGLDATGQRPRP